MSAAGGQRWCVGAAWRRRSENRLLLEFAEAAREVIDTPVAPLRSAFASSICAIFAAATLAAWCVHVDIFAAAQGEIEPLGHSKSVEPDVAGPVTSLLVRDGSHVVAGQLLAEIDPRGATASLVEEREKLEAARADCLRLALEIDLARQGHILPVPALPPASLGATNRSRAQGMLAADLFRLAASLVEIHDRLDAATAERAGAELSLQEDMQIVDTLRQQYAMRRTLNAEGYDSRVNLLAAREQLQHAMVAMIDASTHVAQGRAQEHELAGSAQSLIASFVSKTAGDLKQAEEQVDEATQEMAKARAELLHSRVVAPVAGSVQQMQVTALGQYVPAGQQLMVIVPDRARIEIQAVIENKDVAFVTPGQSVLVKVTAFPFTRYGTIAGRVVRVSHDAVPRGDAARPDDGSPRPAALDQADRSTSQAPHDLVFPVTIRLDRPTIMTDGHAVRLSPGLEVEADIRTGRRRLLQYILSPIAEVVGDSAHER